jgi:hypothetical protein
MKYLSILALLILSSCGTRVTHSHKENGKDINEVTCNGTAYSLADCRKHASRVCNGHFAVLGQESHSTGGYTTVNTYGANSSASGVTVNGIKRSMMFYCTNGQKADLTK